MRTEKQQNKIIKKERKAILKKERNKYIKLICLKCKRENHIHIRIENLEAWEQKRNNYICLLCR